jgi:adenosine deaminase
MKKEIQKLPKVELHVHLDCCLSFELVSKLRPGITQDVYNREFIAPAKCKNLADFLRVIDCSLQLMQTKEALRLVTDDLFEQFQNDNVIYAEIRFAPLLHLDQGLTPEQVVGTIEAAVSEAVERTGIEARLVLCTLRHFDRKQSLSTARLVDRFKGSRVVALDLAADEAGFPVDAHIPAFQYAKEQGIFCTAHAGEAKGPESIRETLEFLKPSRIGHGVRSIEDPPLIEELRRLDIHLEVCPSCNIQVDVFDTYADHPVNRLYDAGVSLGINTDARTVTGISLSGEYERLQEVFGWGEQHFSTCNRNALKAAFLPPETKETLTHRYGLGGSGLEPRA